jgi:hypothetical protein
MAADYQDPKDDPKYSLIVIPPLLPNETDDGKLKIYQLSYREYTAKELPAPGAGVVRELVKYGAAYGYLPTGLGIGIGTMCYLSNLRSLRTERDE